MRQTRTKEEWAIQILIAHLNKSETWNEDHDFTDAPDLVLENNNGSRIACEVTGVGINKWHQWKNDQKKQLDVDKLDSFAVPREADLWLRNIITAKSPKVSDYLSNSNSEEAWLLVHGGIMKSHDFFVLSDEEGYDIPLLQQEASLNEHPFARIFVASSASEIDITQVYPPVAGRLVPPDLSVPNTMKVLEIRSIKKSGLTSGVIEFRMGQEYKPDRQTLLSPLDPTRK